MIITGAEITAWVGAYIWPLIRIGGMVMTAPVFGSKPIPVRIRLIITLAITAVVVPVIAPQTLAVDAFSPLGMLVVAQQLLIGIVMGFAFQLVISAVITGGQTVAMQMGLGFAVMVDPQNGTQAPVLSQFYVLMVLLVFLLLNGHLLLIEIIADSFRSMPIGVEGLKPKDIWQLLGWASIIFSGALSLALPAIASLLLVNIAFGIMTRAAPQLNIFAIGFPITMTIGFAVILVTLPSVIPNSTELFNQTYHLVQQLLRTGGP
ncbi:MAG: flagellar biosynthetic protein FliR [Gammaproteobacteria bacterium]|nr:flagellar biosynthetic protein FliR [Gammaproteobacteria bacterium]MDH5652175.1 flagellar biosynthetic protein FliR [Gammaproteobacteria bacterium]